MIILSLESNQKQSYWNWDDVAVAEDPLWMEDSTEGTLINLFTHQQYESFPVIKKLRQRTMAERNFVVDVLAIIFGIGAWVAINGLWVELPLLVQDLPEGWSLPSYMSIVTQIANIGPISYAILRLLRPSMRPTPVIYVIVSIGCVSSLLLALFWSNTSMIGGEEHSTSLLILVFFLALVDCTSSVLYIPYMAYWRDIYLPSYLIGEGLSGLLPAIVALGQGVGGNAKCINVTEFNDTTGDTTWHLEQQELQPNFSIDVFFYIIFSMMVCSAAAFVMLEVLPLIQEQRSKFLQTDALSWSPKNKETSEAYLVNMNKGEKIMNWKTFSYLIVIQAWSSMLCNGFLPSIQSYSCGPYGNVAYHLAATLSALANPLAAFCTMVLPRAHPNRVGFLSVFGSLFSFYIIATAVTSPAPPLMGTTLGSILVILAWITFVGIITYVRVEIANLMREEGAQALFWSGVSTQAGSAVGAIIAFVLVNKTAIFVGYYPCS